MLVDGRADDREAMARKLERDLMRTYLNEGLDRKCTGGTKEINEQGRKYGMKERVRVGECEGEKKRETELQL